MSTAPGPPAAPLAWDDGSIKLPTGSSLDRMQGFYRRHRSNSTASPGTTHTRNTVAAAPPHPNPITWISFSGSPNESSASFVQSVHRIAFQHDRIKDDEWIAQYAATCFTSSALMWYFGLAKETRSSWETLRVALVQRYPIQDEDEPQPGPGLTTLLSQPYATSSAAGVATSKVSDIGIVEVLRPEFGNSLGFLCRGSRGKQLVQVDCNLENALKFQKVLHTDSKLQHQKIYSLRFVNPPDPEFPFLGLKLVKFEGENPDIVPETSSNNVSWNSIRSHPSWCFPTGKVYDILGKNGGLGVSGQGQSAFATWSLVHTTESGPGPFYMRRAEGSDENARVVSAVWTIFNPVGDVAELGLTWPKGDGRRPTAISEIVLEPVLQNNKYGGLHIHAQDFTRNATDFLNESHVVLVFKQMPSA